MLFASSSSTSSLYGRSSTTTTTATGTSSSQAPASPTSALDLEDDQTTRRPRSVSSVVVQRARRLTRTGGVSFEADVKTHDGLSKRHEVLDSLVKRYFVEQREVSEIDVLKQCEYNASCIWNLHLDLLDMIERIQQAVEEGKGSAPVLPRGGGLCTKLSGACPLCKDP